MTATKSEPTPDTKLTKRQRDVLAAVKEFHADEGRAPSVVELSELLALTSDAVTAALHALVEAGKIRRGKAGEPGAAG